MKFRFFVCLAFLGLAVVACEPLAPEVTQAVIVVTSEPSPSVVASAEPITGAVINERPTLIPSATPFPTTDVASLPTATLPPCTDEVGTLFPSQFDSSISGGTIPYNIYLPPCFFQSGRRFPLLLLLHGSGYTEDQWLDLDIETLLNTDEALAQMVVAMPAGGPFQENNVFQDGISYESILLDEFLPHLKRNYCLWEAQQAIGGISRGGFWAVSIALRYPDQFRAVGGHSAWFVPDNAPATHNPLALAETAQGIESLAIYLDNAQNDDGGANIQVFSNTLRNRGIQHNYVINPIGEHNNDYWGRNLADYLAFYSLGLPRDIAEYPSCQV